MSTLTPSSENNLSDELSLVHSRSSTLNPYPLIIQIINDQQRKLSYPDLPRFAVILGVVHAILLLVAAITFLLKALRRQNGERRKIWLWRKHYVSDETIPYVVPNGSFTIELLQMCGCMCYLLFVVGIYWVVKYPESTPDVHAGLMFWHAVAFVPLTGAIGIWLGGWSAFYVVFLAPTQAAEGRYPRKKSSIQRPLVMNTICISVPVFITAYFLVVGIALFDKLKQVIETYELLKITLTQLSLQWKPNDPMNAENSPRLFNVLVILAQQANQLISIAQAEAAGWATVSISIIAFYIATAIASGRLVKRSILIASGKQLVLRQWHSQDESKESLNGDSTRDSKSKSGIPANTFTNPLVLQRLRRSYCQYLDQSCARNSTTQENNSR